MSDASADFSTRATEPLSRFLTFVGIIAAISVLTLADFLKRHPRIQTAGELLLGLGGVLLVAKLWSV